MPVDDETFDLIATAVGTWHGTGHLFDPTVLDAVVRAGYDRTFDQIGTGPGPAPGPVLLPPPGCDGIGLDPVRRCVTLPAGTHLDLGGIGKGRTADLVAMDLLIGGAQAALVNMGGDMRAAGGLSDGGAYAIAIDDPAEPAHPVTTVDLVCGGLATSSRSRRRWWVDGEARHHLIDPRTGSPARTEVAAVTVMTHAATEAEILAKAALVAGLADGLDLLRDARVAALVIDRRTAPSTASAASRSTSGEPAVLVVRLPIGRLVAWALALASVLWGIALATRALGPRPKAPWLLDLHRHLGGLTVLFTGIHMGALLADTYVHFGTADLLVPFASGWKTGAVAWGVIAFWLLLGIELSSLYMKRIPKVWWRRIHLTAYAVAVMTTIHLFTAGTDATTTALRWATIAVSALTAFFLLYRALGPRTARRVPVTARNQVTQDA